jgi:hypothetical protein
MTQPLQVAVASRISDLQHVKVNPLPQVTCNNWKQTAFPIPPRSGGGLGWGQ